MALPDLIDIEDLYADPAFSAASISADGSRLAYLAPAYGRTQVWVRGIDEEHDDAVCVTHDERRGIKSYFWTDDPRWLLYLQDTDGDEDWHLFRVDLDNPQAPAVDLTPMDVGSRVGGVEPSPSVPGTVLVSMNKRPMHFDTFRVEVATGETTCVVEQPALRTTRFGLDGRSDFETTLADDGSHEFYALDEDGGRRLLVSLGGPEHPLGCYPMQPTPDGRGLLVGRFPEGEDNLVVARIDRETGEETVFAALPGHDVCQMGAHGARWAPILFTSRATGEVIGVRFVGDRPIVLPTDPVFADVYSELSKLSDGVLGWLSSDKEGRRWVATFIHDREPQLTYLYDHETRQSRLLFRPYPRLDPDVMAPMLPVSMPARDGLPLHAFLTLPVGIEPSGLPLVLKVHGGPWSHDTWTFDRDVQFLANRGYAVLQVNFRSSTGYGKKHLTAGIGEWAGKMHDDLIDAADWAVKQGYADPTRIGIFGGSYGGYAALVAVTVTPDYFAAAVDYVGISSLMKFMATLPEFTKPYHQNSFFLYVGDPSNPDDVPELEARSPITMVDKIVTPLLVVQGAMDVRVVRAEADNIVAAMQARGIPVEYLVAEDEGHGFANPENLFTMYRLMEKHFGEHLGGRTAATA
ncbi:MAG TPA: S9 family peptidase [Mycobacteriales bacterium]|nr:S9 family peptidase [Mycobacteriales bacterium]